MKYAKRQSHTKRVVIPPAGACTGQKSTYPTSTVSLLRFSAIYAGYDFS